MYPDPNNNQMVDQSENRIGLFDLADYTLSNDSINISELIASEVSDSLLNFRLEIKDSSSCAASCSQLIWSLPLTQTNVSRIEGTVWLDQNQDGINNEPFGELPLFYGSVIIRRNGFYLGTAEVSAGYYSYEVFQAGEYEVYIDEGYFELSPGNIIPLEFATETIIQTFDGNCGASRIFNFPLRFPCDLQMLDFGYDCINDGAEILYTILFGNVNPPLQLWLRDRESITVRF